MLAKTKWAGVFSWITAVFITSSSFAIRVTEPAGAAHGYPGLCDINGKKLADAEFRQWAENDHLNVVITYKFPDGQMFEEKARFRQERELVQEQWSWKELRNKRTEREFTGDFVSGIASARIRKDNKDVTEKIDVEPARRSNITS
jgi:hypothetical protein